MFSMISTLQLLLIVSLKLYKVIMKKIFIKKIQMFSFIFIAIC